MNITVYCGANVGNKPQYQQAAHALGEWIAKGQQSINLWRRKSRFDGDCCR